MITRKLYHMITCANLKGKPAEKSAGFLLWHVLRHGMQANQGQELPTKESFRQIGESCFLDRRGGRGGGAV